jgi:hypothetical protein
MLQVTIPCLIHTIHDIYRIHGLQMSENLVSYPLQITTFLPFAIKALHTETCKVLHHKLSKDVHICCTNAMNLHSSLHCVTSIWSGTSIHIIWHNMLEVSLKWFLLPNIWRL